MREIANTPSRRYYGEPIGDVGAGWIKLEAEVLKSLREGVARPAGEAKLRSGGDHGLAGVIQMTLPADRGFS